MSELEDVLNAYRNDELTFDDMCVALVRNAELDDWKAIVDSLSSEEQFKFRDRAVPLATRDHELIGAGISSLSDDEIVALNLQCARRGWLSKQTDADKTDK